MTNRSGSVAGGGRMRRVAAVVDAALPVVVELLDLARVPPVLADALPNDSAITAVTGGAVRYKPGRRLIARYDVVVDGETRVAWVWADRSPKLAQRMAPGRLLDADRHVLIGWYPDDVAMPVLAHPGGAGRAVGVDADTELLAFKPAARAVVRAGDAIVKTYSDDEHYQEAADALRRIPAQAAEAGFATARCLSCEPPLRATVQQVIDGEPGHRDRDAHILGAVLRKLHSLPTDGLRVETSEWSLAAARSGGTLVAHLVPYLRTAVDALLRDLERTQPHGLELVTSHGDFEAGQVMVGPRVPNGAAIIDLDMLCAAPVARDLGNYAVHFIRGDGREVSEACANVRVLLDGYESEPPALAWHMAAAALSRAPSPFRKFMTDWPARLEAMVDAAGELLLGRVTP